MNIYRILFVAVITIFGISPASAQQAPVYQDIDLPDIGDPTGSMMTPHLERTLGRAFMRSVRAHMDVIDDPVMAEYIQSLGDKLVAKSSDAGSRFTFFLIDDPVVNAFAGPAGYIGFYRGLVLASQTESELASVVAHEISHVTQRHIYRSIQAAQNMTIPNAALLLGALLVGAANPDMGAAALAGVQAGAAQQQINFTRSNEQEADNIGIRLMAESGYDPRDMAIFFNRMGKATRLYGSGNMPEFLRTHPVTTSRIADAQARAEKYPYVQPKEDIRYYLMKAWFRVREFNSASDAIYHFKKTLEEGRYQSRDAQSYGLALSYILNKEYDEAIEIMTALLKQSPQNEAFIVVMSNAEMNGGKPTQAMERLENQWLLNPESYSISMTYASALLYLGIPERAYEILTRLAESRPDDALVYKMLAQAAGESGKIIESHRYLAEYYYNNGNPEAASRQLQIALRDKDIPYYEAEQMEARLQIFKQEVYDLENRL